MDSRMGVLSGIVALVVLVGLGIVVGPGSPGRAYRNKRDSGLDLESA